MEHKQRTREVERHLTSLEAHMQCVGVKEATDTVHVVLEAYSLT